MRNLSGRDRERNCLFDFSVLETVGAWRGIIRGTITNGEDCGSIFDSIRTKSGENLFDNRS